ncbi:hypothetical protein C922_03312 [Plasmodium inui San Antonio 1]|uniref:Uncharacterized protein n=1 Tax=Plasmodium inui San Antonio 1 TaxID=1237626 RepID=W7AM36_9APIC|nr:hypothetical protein C922_03312 [Plasmodium inui San Antonio 1]EUD66396.1 hypothetical protein C922_03312 [Plasmodium inui San Antonio 1]
MTISIPAYMGSLWDLITRSEAELSGPGGGARLLDLKVQKKGGEIIGEWHPSESKEKQAAVGYQQHQFATNICGGLEIWGSNLTEDESGNLSDFRSGCSPKATGRAVSGNLLAACSRKGESWKWDTYNRTRQLHYQQTQERQLATCIDLISIIIHAFEMKAYTGTTGSVDVPADACDRVYTLLKLWGGTRVAQQIMQDWFIHNPNLQLGRGAQLNIGGALYVKIAEFLGHEARDYPAKICRSVRGKPAQGTLQQSEHYTLGDYGEETINEGMSEEEKEQKEEGERHSGGSHSQQSSKEMSARDTSQEKTHLDAQEESEELFSSMGGKIIGGLMGAGSMALMALYGMRRVYKRSGRSKCRVGGTKSSGGSHIWDQGGLPGRVAYTGAPRE